jgi:hypothetical protein
MAILKSCDAVKYSGKVEYKDTILRPLPLNFDKYHIWLKFGPINIQKYMRYHLYQVWEDIHWKIYVSFWRFSKLINYYITYVIYVKLQNYYFNYLYIS